MALRASEKSSGQTQQKTPKWDPLFEPLMAEIIGSEGLKIKRAIEVGKCAVEFFRGPDFVRWVSQKSGHLLTKYPNAFAALGSKVIDDTSATVETVDPAWLAEELIKRGFIYRAKYVPLAPGLEEDGQNGKGGKAGAGGAKKAAGQAVPKWPSRLSISRVQVFDPDAFYVVLYEPPSAMRYILLGLLVGVVLLICMFPAWPLGVKLALWYVSVVLLTLLMIIIVLRLITFLLLWFLGCDFWVFPNLFSDELGVIDSFKPVYSFEKRKDDWIMVCARVALAGLVCGALYQLSQTHSVADVQRFATRQFMDVLDWGHQKLTETSQDLKASNLHAMKEEEKKVDLSCMKTCGFEENEFSDGGACTTDKECMDLVVTSICFKKRCNVKTRQLLEDIQANLVTGKPAQKSEGGSDEL